MYEWNAVVDSYILKSFDLRPTFEIELEAKIDSRGGPLHKRCEATGCLNVAGRDIEKMMCCSGCKLVGDVVLFVCGRLTHCCRSCTAVGSVSQEIGRDTRRTADPRRITHNFYPRN